MKNTLMMIAMLAIASCTPDKLQMADAKKVVVQLLEKIDQGNYSTLNDYYTANFNQSESKEERIKKLQTLKKISGDVTALELTDSLSEEKFAEESRIVLTYKITHTKITTIETFNVVWDEGGYKVSQHSVKSEGL